MASTFLSMRNTNQQKKKPNSPNLVFINNSIFNFRFLVLIYNYRSSDISYTLFRSICIVTGDGYWNAIMQYTCCR